jgi:hypothetical protein
MALVPIGVLLWMAVFSAWIRASQYAKNIRLWRTLVTSLLTIPLALLPAVFLLLFIGLAVTPVNSIGPVQSNRWLIAAIECAAALWLLSLLAPRLFRKTPDKGQFVKRLMGASALTSIVFMLVEIIIINQLGPGS